ncbi:hypothetical protein D3C85_927680 [compost metagenome]
MSFDPSAHGQLQYHYQQRIHGKQIGDPMRTGISVLTQENPECAIHLIEYAQGQQLTKNEDKKKTVSPRRTHCKIPCVFLRRRNARKLPESYGMFQGIAEQ